MRKKRKLAIKKATMVFDSKEKGIEWLHTPNQTFNWQTPWTILNTNYRLVLDTLGRIEHGVFI